MSHDIYSALLRATRVINDTKNLKLLSYSSIASANGSIKKIRLCKCRTVQRGDGGEDTRKRTCCEKIDNGHMLHAHSVYLTMFHSDIQTLCEGIGCAQKVHCTSSGTCLYFTPDHSCC